MDSLRVSIVIPVFNGANYLDFAIQSALNQTYSNTEVIVVNDGSTDDGATEQLVRRYGDRVRYIRKSNGGSSSALNAGVAAMSGDYFSWLSHDDMYHPEKIARQIDLLNRILDGGEGGDPGKHVIVCESEIIGPDGSVLARPTPRILKRNYSRLALMTDIERAVAVLSDLAFHGCSYLLPRGCFSDLGGFDESLRLVNDMEFWFRLLTHGYHLHLVPEVLVQGRMHRDQISESFRASRRGDDGERTAFLSDVVESCYSSKEPKMARVLLRLANRLNTRGLEDAANQAYRRSGELSSTIRYVIPFYKYLTLAQGRVRRRFVRLYVRFRA